ncbi:MAG: hypothetical protein PHE73_07505 [Sulfurovaceae bacterium]|nr:hypothetical protein [Sulfurovaceae bacterium]
MNEKIFLGIFGLLCFCTFSYGAEAPVSNNTALLEQKIQEQNERIDGLTSIVEGLNTKISELEEINNNSDSKNDKKLIEDLGKMIDDINSKCVTKDELKKILDEHSNKYDSAASIPDKTKAYDNGILFFRNKQYDKAKEQFLAADKQGYKSAATNYYMGEIAYYEKRYKDAIFYFKKSAKLDDQANYIDILLLHTAISLENTNDKSQAKLFYETIIEKFPIKDSAKIAKKRLDGMM